MKTGPLMVTVLFYNQFKMIKYTTLLLGALFIFASCLSTDPAPAEKHVAMFFKADNIAETIEIEDNEIVIEEFKFAIDRFSLFGADDLELETGGLLTAMIFAYTEEITDYRLIIDVGLGFSDDFQFNGYKMYLEPIQNRTGIMDDDFFSEEANYSVIIKGVVNEMSFEFRSSEEFEKRFDFNRVQLSDQNETIAFRKSVDLINVFINDENGFLDPRDEENELEIIKNIENNLEIAATAEDLGQ